MGLLSFFLMSRAELPVEIRAVASLIVALGVQLIALFVVQQRTVKRSLGRIDSAVENISQLGFIGSSEHNQDQGSVESRLHHSHQALQHLQHESAQALVDAKLTQVRVGHLDSVLNSLPFGVMVFDAEARVAFANRALSPMLGRASQQLAGQRLGDWCDIPELNAYLAQRLEKKQHAGNSIRVSHPQRPNRWIEVDIRDLADAGQDACVACFYDATDAVQAQNARGEFVTSLSHELKTPLHTMNLFAETLRGPDGEDAEIRLDAANVIGDEIERIDSLIRSLLDATRIETGTLNIERTRVRLPELLADSLARVEANLKEREITLVSNIPKTMQAVFLDKSLFSVALNNLLSNAVKYNKDQGTVTVEMAETDDEVSITIADTGVGIPEKELPFVFDKFYRASNVGKDGHGVGLALAREIVQKHHGRLSVDSVEGRGTSFTLTLNKTAALTREAA